jgi:D-alanyl-D-alanine carboxypeptidase/D-alanyl-D-alanine endopeptidase (penicillin-binding protein 7)
MLSFSLPRVIKSVFSVFILAAGCAAVQAAPGVPFSSQSALVIEEGTGRVLLEKNSDKVVSIASLTKLMTAMVVLDAGQDMNEPISIDQADVDMLKHSSSRLPVGATLPRREILQLALMSSDNRAAASLARTYPGGNAAFLTALHAKIASLGMSNTVIEEPTGLSPHNQSTATDLIKMAMAASAYPDISRITTDTGDQVKVNNRTMGFRNTNHFVGQKGWEILLSKTGYTLEAGRCLIMRMKSAGKNVVLVLLNAKESAGRSFDAMAIQRFLTGAAAPQPAVRRQVAHNNVRRKNTRSVQVAKA